MASKTTLDIKLHPLSWKVLQNQYKYDGIAVDLGKGWAYNLVVQGLRRHPVMSPWEFNRMPQGLVDGKVYVLNYDVQRYGAYMSIAKQANVSVVIFKMERERLCQLTAEAHVMGGFSRDVAMQYFLDFYDYTEDEISFAALRKHYQRHYRHKEEDIILNVNELNKEKKHKNEQ